MLAIYIFFKDAADSTRRRAFTTLTITVMDEDDQNPVFAYPGCSGSSCIVPPYEAITGLAETVCVFNNLLLTVSMRYF